MVEVVRATQQDAQELYSIQLRAFAPDVQLYGEGPPGYDSLQELHKEIAKYTYLKILYNQKIAGGACLSVKNDDRIHLGRLYIDPSLQDLGIGKQAIRLMEVEWPNRTWTLDTPYLSFRNHHFYKSLGYRKVGEYQPEHMKGTPFILFLYEKIAELSMNKH